MAAEASDRSAFAPFRSRAFRYLWLAIVVSSIGGMAQTTGAQWLFVNDPNAATIVSLIQTASMLPMMILSLPAGVLADAFDRRSLLIGVQVYAVVVSSMLALFTYLGKMPPLLLLAFTFAVGSGMALQVATWPPLISELVPRSHLAAATRLDMVSVNVARAAGPAIAGLIIARAGVAPVFAFTATCVTVLLGVLLVWRRRMPSTGPRERFLPALRAGGRYVWHEPVVRLILGRLAMFVAPGSALWALLPVIARQQLGLDAGGFGLLYAALGSGAVIGALTLGWVKRRLSSNMVVTVAMTIYGVGIAVVMLSGSLWTAMPVLVVAGYRWTAVASVLVSEMQLFLPGWVRGRALAVYSMTFTGVMALTSPVWGLGAQVAGLRYAMWAAAALVLLGAGIGQLVRVPDNEGVDQRPIRIWDDAAHARPLAPEVGPVVIEIDFRVPTHHQEEFLTAMQSLRRSRLRNGATHWGLHRVLEQPETYVEQFTVSSWQEHLLTHEVRLTVADQTVEQRVLRYATGEPRSRHLLPPDAEVPDPER